MNPEPAFAHDCDKCIYLGTVVRSETIEVTDEVAAALTAHVEKATLADLHAALGIKPPEVFDLYCCEKQGTGLGATVIARYGDGGPEYKSGLVFTATDPELGLAFELARKAGHLSGVKP